MDKKEQQPSMTVEEQVKNLLDQKLVLVDREYAMSFLNDVSYFRLIKAYSLGLKPKNGDYNDGVTFEQIVELYKFNCNFRQALFSDIERVEVNLRCRLANYFSSKYGVLGYENKENFANADYHSEFIDDVAQELKRNAKSPFVKNFQNNFKDSKVPMYALVELFSFGTLSKFFKNMKNEDKKAVALTYNIGYTYFESWIESIAYVRNLCAHYGRLYNAKLSIIPMLYKQYSGVGIDNIRVFGVLLCIKHLVPHDIHWYDFVDQIELFIEKYPHVNIDTMGFPEDWKALLLT
jgi:abortive infection bacteriophage resistance protein